MSQARKDKDEEEDKNIKALDSKDIEILKTYVRHPIPDSWRSLLTSRAKDLTTASSTN